jgi:hypothetical protein
MKMTSKSNYTTATYDALVDLAHSLRPTWDQAGIRAAIRAALIRQPMPTLADLAYALVRLAIDPTIVTPSVLGMDGPHWHTSTAQHTAPPPPGKFQVSHGYHTPDAPHNRPYTPTDWRPALANVRAAYTQATAGHCPHGVPWTNCHQHKDTA